MRSHLWAYVIPAVAAQGAAATDSEDLARTCTQVQIPSAIA
jgi:hypothetical protein